MRKILASLLLISSLMCCNSFESDNHQKAKHRYGEKILVFIR